MCDPPAPPAGSKLDAVNNMRGMWTIPSLKFSVPGAGTCEPAYPGNPCKTWDPTVAFCQSDACLASCPHQLDAHPCSQHDCRVWNTRKILDPTSYSGWLTAGKCVAYRWANDEYACTSAACGWGGADQPANCDAVVTALQMSGNSPYNASSWYSCGRVVGPSNVKGGTWWGSPSSVGCTTTEIAGTANQPSANFDIPPGSTLILALWNVPYAKTPQAAAPGRN